MPTDTQVLFIDVDELRVGLYIYLDLGWMEHPFAFNHFKIKSESQIETIRGLGLKHVRWSPELSDLAPPVSDPKGPDQQIAPRPSTEQSRQRLVEQQASLARCEREFAQAARTVRELFRLAPSHPDQVRERAQALAGSLVQELLSQNESCIRLLSEQPGEQTALHSINVSVIALLLGQRLGLERTRLDQLVLGAVLHDIGKCQLPERVRWIDTSSSAAERKLFQRHVGEGIELARRMQLDPEIVSIIAQHHEYVDGSGFPAHLSGEQMGELGRIVSLVNHYDTLCNPANPVTAITPHQALSIMFAQSRDKFDANILAVFIRMMGVYPPGSVVVLSDGRYALVVSVNSARPLKPSVIIHDPRVAREEAPVVDLEQTNGLCIQRSIRPLQLPRPAFDYLLPRQRICYFFERARLHDADPAT